MQKKITAWSEDIPCQYIEDPPHPLVCTAEFVYLLSYNLECNPIVYASADNVLWIYYPNSCLVCEDLFENYGLYMAMSRASVYGGADGFESGELKSEFAKGGNLLHCIKQNVSGNDFELIRDIAVKIPFESKSLIDEYKKIISGVNGKIGYLVAERTELTENIFNEISQKSNDTYYRYIVLNDSENYLNALSIEQKKKKNYGFCISMTG